MRTTEAQSVAAGHSLEVDPACWQAALEELPGRFAGRFVYGLLADLPRKTCWTIAEHAGDASLMGCSTTG